MLKIYFLKKSRNTNKNYVNCQIPLNISDFINFIWPHHAISIVFRLSTTKYSLYIFTLPCHAINIVFKAQPRSC